MDPSQTARKIKSMEIRGALKIALTAAESMREFAAKHGDEKDFLKQLQKQSEILKAARPTAVSLPNAVDYVLYKARNSDKEALIKEINKFIKDQKDALKKLAKIGAKRLEEGDTVLTHCNSTAALELIREAHDSGKKIRVVCTETRPRHQGYLTAQYMAKHKIPVTLIIDSAVRYAMKKMDIDKVVIGADTVTANGSIANKIGTSQIALIAHEANVPVICACETLKFSPQSLSGKLIPIEERDHAEIRAPLKGVEMLNPAFDFTPPEYIDIIVTEDGVISPYMVYEVLKDKFGWEITN
jgi:ribose 1,5-bisphosphate isomerase